MRRHLPTPGDPVTLVVCTPTADQYLQLRRQTGRSEVSVHDCEKGLAASLHSVCAMHRNQVVGIGRLVGDGTMYCYIQDMIVDRDYRGRGIGTRIMHALLDWLRQHAGHGVFVGLMAADGEADFYTRFGFQPRPAQRPGMFLPAETLFSGSEISPRR